MKKDPNTSLVGIGIAGGVVAVLCCISPLIITFLGVGVGSFFAGLYTYKLFFIGASIVFLGVATFLIVRGQNNACRTIKTRLWTALLLSFGIGLIVYLVLTYAIIPSLARRATNSVAEQRSIPVSASTETITADLIRDLVIVKAEEDIPNEMEPENNSLPTNFSSLDVSVDGMFCAGCIVGIQSLFLEIDGIEQAEYDWDEDTFSLQYDPLRITEDSILQVELPEPYKLRKPSNFPS